MTGCFAQTSPQRAAMPEVDHVVGLGRLPDMLRAVRGELGGAERVLVDDLRKARPGDARSAPRSSPARRAPFSRCRRAAISSARSASCRSRAAAAAASSRAACSRELERLAARGFREVVLTGIHLGGYGQDLTPALDLADLVEMIAEAAPVPRLRLSSIDPPEVTPRLLDLMARSAVLCPHLHVPVQAGADGVLAPHAPPLRRAHGARGGGGDRARVAATPRSAPT